MHHIAGLQQILGAARNDLRAATVLQGDPGAVSPKRFFLRKKNGESNFTIILKKYVKMSFFF